MRGPKFALAALLCFAAQAREAAIDIDPVKSRVHFTLTDVLHTVHGTFRVKSGSVRFNIESGQASGRIVVDVASGDSGGGARDKRMHREILQSDRYPEAVFTIDRVSGSLAAIEAHGMLRIHGQDHEVTVTGKVTIQDGRAVGRAAFTMPYVSWGMRDPSVFMLHVNDKVQIDIVLEGAVATERP